jgi:hypothetical protein
MTITLEGLTPTQYKLADMLWSCESQEDVAKFIAALPAEYKREAVTVHQLMIAAVFDDYEEITDDVKDLIRTISSR